MLRRRTFCFSRWCADNGYLPGERGLEKRRERADSSTVEGRGSAGGRPVPEGSNPESSCRVCSVDERTGGFEGLSLFFFNIYIYIKEMGSCCTKGRGVKRQHSAFSTFFDERAGEKQPMGYTSSQFKNENNKLPFKLKLDKLDISPRRTRPKRGTTQDISYLNGRTKAP